MRKKVQPEKIAVLGAGSWGTALARLLAQKGHRVVLWGRNRERIEEMKKAGENRRYLPGVNLPPNLVLTWDLEKAMAGCHYVVLAVPAQSQRRFLEENRRFFTGRETVINVAKGLEKETSLPLSQVYREATGCDLENYVVLSGPSHAEEVGRDMPTAVVVAGLSRRRAEAVQDLFLTRRFRVYTHPDLTGVELAGALKNVIALGTGIAEGVGYGDNSKAALITRGLVEITRLGVAMGAHPATFSGLAGLGDLVVTCTSRHSRNRRAGIGIGRGKSLEEVLAEVGMVVEGVATTTAALKLARERQVEMPIVSATYAILYEGLKPEEAVEKLMGRQKKHEMEELAAEAFAGWN